MGISVTEAPTEVTLTYFRDNLRRVLKAVKNEGKTYVITKENKPFARLVPLSGVQDPPTEVNLTYLRNNLLDTVNLIKYAGKSFLLVKGRKPQATLAPISDDIAMLPLFGSKTSVKKVLH
jgi:prevent-host-death family protein